MEGLGGCLIAAAIAVSGCSLLVLSCLRHKAQAMPQSCICKEANVKMCTRDSKKAVTFENEGSTSSPVIARRQVRFSDEVEYISINKYTHGGKVDASKVLLNKGKKTIYNRARKKGASLPENWINLYNGLNCYRSQQAILNIYA